MPAVTNDAPSKPSRLAERLNVRPVMLRIDDFSAISGLGRTKIYEMIGARELRSVMVAGRRLIPTSEADRLLNDALAKTPQMHEVV